MGPGIKKKKGKKTEGKIIKGLGGGLKQDSGGAGLLGRVRGGNRHKRGKKGQEKKRSSLVEGGYFPILMGSREKEA